MKQYLDKNGLQDYTRKLTQKYKTMFSSPLIATTAAEMTDTTKVYVYIGSESGYTSGNWYYYNGTNWESGGIYNAVAVETDKTLTIEGKAADAKATGEAIININPSDAATGNPITINDNILKVKNLKLSFTPMQEGSGTPAIDNYRAIVANSNLSIIVNGQAETISLQNPVYGGVWDVTGGKFSPEWIVQICKGTETITVAQTTATLTVFNLFVLSTNRVPRDCFCTHLETLPQGYVNVSQKAYTIGNRTDSIGVKFSLGADFFGDNYATMTAGEKKSAVLSWMAAQYAAGTPFMVCAKPYTTQADIETDAITIDAAGKNNVFSSDFGEIEINYSVSFNDFMNEALKENSYNDAVYKIDTIKGIAHRGISAVAPENTVAAFKLAKYAGFDAIETDIAYTSDGYAVCIHDATINRTSNGTGNVVDMTLEQLKTYDFGSWKNTIFAEEKIPTFEEFLSVCRECGLEGYVELKTSADNSAANVEKLTNAVKAYELSDKITWISFDETALRRVRANLPAARLGYISGGAGDAVLTTATALKNDTNKVFVDAGSIAAANITNYISNNIGLEMWTVDNVQTMAEADPYVTGFTSNSISASKELPKYALENIKGLDLI